MIFSTLLAAPARAEYRAFQLIITDSADGTTREDTSTLDDLQYPGYHHVKKTETVQIKSSWRCWERSDYHQPICPDPKAPPEPLELE